MGAGGGQVVGPARKRAGELQGCAVRTGDGLHIHAVLLVLLRVVRLICTDPVGGDQGAVNNDEVAFTQAQPAAELDRDRAWMHLLENPGGVRRQRHGGVRRLLEIAGTYDRICQRVEGYLQPDVSATDILAVLRVIRTLRDKLDDDERMLLALARSKTITCARIATALEMSGRQSAERRYLQLSRAYRRPDGTLPRTQSERLSKRGSSAAAAPNGSGTVSRAQDPVDRIRPFVWGRRCAGSVPGVAAKETRGPCVRRGPFPVFPSAPGVRLCSRVGGWRLCGGVAGRLPR